ncbi:MAG: hypothetical protein IT386_16210 [Deltaproteobacteria bacterium]|nr:hypothetical protein [Deltaproteobacteria bacterium]
MAEGLGEKILRVVTLDGDVFDDVARDERQTGSALSIVFAVALASGLGRMPGGGLRGLLLGALEICLPFCLWLAVMQGALVAMGRPDRLAPLFRALGFSLAPFSLALFQAFPLLGPLVSGTGVLLGLATSYRAVQRAGLLAPLEAGALCFTGLFAALWGSSVLLSIVQPR